MIGLPRCLLLFIVFTCGLCSNALAHEVRPGYLELREIDPNHWDVLWKVPALGETPLGIHVQLPGTCGDSKPGVRLVNNAYISRWRTHCSAGLIGNEVRIDGLSATRTDVLARVERVDGTTLTERLTPAEPAFTVTAAQSWIQVASSYLGLGIEHILLGIDHLLFVLALLFLVGNWPRLIGTITSFTLAHSLTLAAATLGWIHVPQAPVEAAIALSIVFVATEILHTRQGRAGLAARMPWLIAFLFGLLHGLGFAGALREIGLPEHAIPWALAFFNIGVELGQLLFIAVLFALIRGVRPVWYRSAADSPNPWGLAARLSAPAAYLIGTLAMFWVFDRTYGFLV